jgi:hypothetical protein
MGTYAVVLVFMALVTLKHSSAGRYHSRPARSRKQALTKHSNIAAAAAVCSFQDFGMQKILPDVSFLAQWRDKIEAVSNSFGSAAIVMLHFHMPSLQVQTLICLAATCVYSSWPAAAAPVGVCIAHCPQVRFKGSFSPLNSSIVAGGDHTRS